MAMVHMSATSALSDSEIIAGEAGQRVRITRICFSANAGATLHVYAKASGKASTPLLGWLRTAGPLLDLRLGRRYGVTTEPGDSVTVSVEIGGATPAVALTLWYERVP